MKLVLGIDLDLAHFHKLLVHYVSYNNVVRNGVLLDKDQNSGCILSFFSDLKPYE